MKGKAYAIIMAGGKGERFWPLSTSRHPKQTLTLFTGKPMLLEAVERVRALIPPDRVLIVTSKDLVKPIQKAVPFLPTRNIIGEPMGRDTAAACAVGTAIARSRDPNAICCILTADHVIKQADKFRRILRESVKMAGNGDCIVTLGIKPTFPSTGFGYIKTAGIIGRRNGIKFIKAERFVEKPNLAKARGYVRSGRYYWNGGMFIWSARTFFKALRRYAPHLLPLSETIAGTRKASAVNAILRRIYPNLKKISVDYAIMEKHDNIVTAETDIGWSDIGSWSALEDHFRADKTWNVLIGNVESLGSSGNIVVSEGRMTAMINVRDMIVVQAKGVTLICRKDSAQKVKDLVKVLTEKDGYRTLL